MNSQETDKEKGQGKGLRGRIVPPTPPSPIPTTFRSKAASANREATRAAQSALGKKPTAPVKEEQPEEDSAQSVVRAGGSMAVATMLSRITGFVRNVMIGSSLGPAVGSAFNTANTLPNLITEIVLGAVLTSLVVPVLVRAEKEDPDRGAAFIRRLLTLSVSLLLFVTIIAVAAAPFLTRLSLGAEGKVNISQSTAFAYFLLPQILFYGVFALFMAILNTKGVFKPGAWAPVLNNIVVIAVLGIYWLLPGGFHPDEQVSLLDPHVLLLGLGTTLGVVVQALIMLPYLKKQNIDLRPLWGIDARLKQFTGMAIAIVIYVGISQAGYILTTRIASSSDPTAPMIYQQAWLFLQVPYGIIGVTLLTALMPRLSRAAANGDHKGVVNDLTMATKITFLALIPIIIFMTVFGVEIANALFAYGAFDRQSADLLGTTLSFSAFTLIPYALVLLHLRVFYAREEAWTPTFIIAGITTTKVILSFLATRIAASPRDVVVLLGTANGFGFVAGACIGALLLRRKLGKLQAPSILHTTAWTVGASVVGAFVAYYVDMALAHVIMRPELHILGSVVFIFRVAVDGVVFLIVTGLVLSRSKLEELRSLSAVGNRIPGLRKFIKTEAPTPVSTPTEVSMHLQISEEAITVLPLPPMSAGMVRPPRLVPGAPIANGSFRLLKNHGSIPGATFWQAIEQSTGREVALTFVDTEGTRENPVAPATAAGIASEVARRSRRIAGLSTAGIKGLAPNMRLSTYRAGCLIVADWVPGVALSDVPAAEPQSAALAVASLAAAAATAESARVPLGMADISQIRIDTNGNAVLAFPAVLPGASYERDIEVCLQALKTLLGTSPHKVESLENLCLEDPHAISAQDLAHRLAATGSEGEQLAIDEEAQPTPVVPGTSGGFGGRGYSSQMKVLIAIASVVAVIIAAIAALTIVGGLGQHRRNAPVQSNVIPAITDNPTTRPTEPAFPGFPPGANDVNNPNGTDVNPTADTNLPPAPVVTETPAR
ncbi:MAG: murein biosynthesis integral membrane protein MurJ [Corynebacterium sp.]|nr:murein biosynthesis integral membrane protein MurJ [Corynebacterium sp.]